MALMSLLASASNSKSWDKAVKDGFVPGETLFEIEEALKRGTIICYLLSDAAQIATVAHCKKTFNTRQSPLFFSWLWYYL